MTLTTPIVDPGGHSYGDLEAVGWRHRRITLSARKTSCVNLERE
jgi:hypothetical protein